MKKYILLFFAIYFSLTGSLLAQNITLLGSTTVSAKGSGTAGKPANFNWDIPAGENRVMVVHFWFERDHRPAPFQDNYPSGNFGADFFPMAVGSQNMTGRTVLRSFAISGSGTASASNSEFGTLFYRYTLSDSQGLPTGVTTFDFSGIETPLNTADEVAVSIEVYGNVSPATTYAGASTSSYGYASTSNQTTTFSVTPTATTAPSGRVANDVVYVGFGATSKDENISISSAGWTSINNVRVNNNVGNAFTGNDLSISNEADGISLLTSYRNGIAGTTLTKSSNQGIAYVRLNIVPLLPLAKPSVSGTVYRDTDGPTNINGTGINAGGSYINVVDPATNLVVSSVAVAASGTFTIPAGVLVEGTTYHFQLSKNQGTVNSAPPVMGLSGYSYVGEDLDATGNDGTADGILDVAIGTTATVGLRFGVNTCAAGVTAPVVQNITNTCPATTVNLNTAHTGTVPAGSSLVWFTNYAHTGTALSGTQVTQAGSGTYYAFYYDSIGNCYSNASNAVEANIIGCYTCPPDPYAAQQTWWLPRATSKIRIDFQTGSPVLNNPAAGFLGQGTTGGFEGNATVTHPVTGELLFVTDGNRLYRGADGTLASGPFVGGNGSSEEAAAAIPDPQGILGRDFIVFGNSAANVAGTLNSAKYNLETNTISNVTTLLPASSIYEALEVIPHTNGTDYWILVNTADQKVKSYLYSKLSGFNTTPVSSVDVADFAGVDASAIAINSFISWDPRNPGKVLIARHNKVGLANFNPSTGNLGSWQVYVTTATDFAGYSAALSPNGRYLYYDDYNSGPNTHSIKYIDITTGITTTLLSNAVAYATGFKIGQDGKLYVVQWNTATSAVGLFYLNANANTPPTTTGSVLLFDTGGRAPSSQLPNNVYWACATCQSGTNAPTLPSTIITPNPATVGDLIALLSAGNQPAGTVITIHSGATATDANKLANNASISIGNTYYASFYDGLAICYSPTTPVTPASIVCDQAFDGIGGTAQTINSDGNVTDTFQTALLGSASLGGERDIAITNKSSIVLPYNLLVYAGSSNLEISHGGGDRSLVTVQYDGIDGNAQVLNPTGLGGIDFSSTEGIGFTLETDGNPFTVTVELWSNAGAASSYTKVYPASTPITGLNEIYQFSDFTTLIGSGADLTSIGAVVFKYDNTSGANSDINVYNIRLACVSSYCYKPGILDAGNTYPTKHGITALGRAGAENENWPMLRQSAWTVLESKEKGFVVNRVATTAGLINITDPVEGMMVYDEEADCLKIFTLKSGDTEMDWHCFVTPACPD